jgi:hypothetical protein
MRLIPNILGRFAHQVLLSTTSSLSTFGYRLRVANTLDNAYGPQNGVGGIGTARIAEVVRGGFFASPSVSAMQLPDNMGTNKSLFFYDPQDFLGLNAGPFDAVLVPGAVVPPDDAVSYVRLQVQPEGGSFPAVAPDQNNQGPILIIPPPGFFSVPRPVLTIYGTSPQIVGALAGQLPPLGSMAFHVPAHGDALVLTNNGPGVLLVAFGEGLPLIPIAVNQPISFTSGMKDVFYVVSAGGNPTFSIMLSIVSGTR